MQLPARTIRREEDPGEGASRHTEVEHYNLQLLQAHKCAGLPGFTGSETTVMIRNIKCGYTQEDVKKILDRAALRGKFDLVYVPLNVSSRSNFGYTFVNFRAPQYVKECIAAIDGLVFGGGDTAKRCKVVPARVQGFVQMMAVIIARSSPEGHVLFVDDKALQSRGSLRFGVGDACDMADIHDNHDSRLSPCGDGVGGIGATTGGGREALGAANSEHMQDKSAIGWVLYRLSL